MNLFVRACLQARWLSAHSDKVHSDLVQLETKLKPKAHAQSLDTDISDSGVTETDRNKQGLTHYQNQTLTPCALFQKE